jgi:D-serine deaminase-like pyridoxal phosphate-dependent protein
MTIFSTIKKPTLVLDEVKAKRNLKYINDRIYAQRKRFRPHFKTHQSAEIGEWFRNEGITSITVSSLEMAKYFADEKWDDIFVAFPVNILQIEEIIELSDRIQLSLLFEDPITVSFIDHYLSNSIDGWIKIDTGAQRCGLKPDQIDQIVSIAKELSQSKFINPRGLITHAGHTYHCKTNEQVIKTYQQSVQDLNEVRNTLGDNGFSNLEISVGDTPSSSLVDDFGLVDELRLGNFLFYDVQQFQAGVCNLEDIAVSVVCPVVAIHPEQNEAVIYGGAIHFSKDSHKWEGMNQAYGLITLPSTNGWDDQRIYGYLRSLSQEHGVAVFPEGIPENVKVGSLICVLPAHSCLTVQAMQEFINLDGEIITTMLA